MTLSAKEDPSLLVYELNEVPPRIIFDYCKLRPESTIAKIIRSNKLIPTECTDEGELHPWSTWPTLHRGVSSSLHNIRSLNQDLTAATNYPPVWEVLIHNKINIGIFGSLHSYPYPGESPYISFYVPDTFAPQPLCSSERLTRLQRFNLMMSSSNKAYSRPINYREIFFFLRLLLTNQLSLPFITSTLKQLSLELFHSHYKERRSFLQPVLFFENFKSELYARKPGYASFFSNHVASVMHRFWHHTFPSDLNQNIQYSHIRRAHIWKAMDIVDKQLSDLTIFCKKNYYDLWVLTSMGQQSLEEYADIAELVIEDPLKLISFFNFTAGEVESMPSMHPDINFKCNSQDTKTRLKECIGSLLDSQGKQIAPILYDSDGLTVNFTISSSQPSILSKLLILKQKEYLLSELGISIIKRQRATAYHHSTGSFLYSGNRSAYLLKNYSDNNPLNTTRIHDLILAFFDL